MGPAPSTGQASVELKSTYQLGLECEQLVANYYVKNGFRFLRQRWRTPFAEVDLLLQSPGGKLIVCEVKHLSHHDYLSIRLTQRQKRRLRSVVCWLAEQGREVEFHLVVVSQKFRIEVFPDILG